MRRGFFGAVATLIFATVFPISSHAAIGPGVGVVTTNLLMHWDWGNDFSYPSSGTLTSDLADYNETATSNSGVSYATSNGGTVGFATGTSQYLTVPSFTYDFSSGFSASFYADFGSGDNFERIIDFGIGQWNQNIAIFRLGTSTDLTYGVYNNGSDKSLCTATGAILNNTFAHYAVTISSTGTCKMYRNGSALTVSQTAADARPNNIQTRTSNFIGHSNWSADANSGLLLGDLAIYNSELSAAAIGTNYISQTNLTAPTLGNNTATVSENQTTGLTLSSSEAASFYIVGGADSDKFNINQNTGAITFKSAPNFEIAADSGGNNIYDVAIRAVDLYGNSTDIAVAITITNVSEFATLTFNSLSANPFKGISVMISVTPTAGGTAGKISYLANGKRIPRCYRINFTGSGISSCSWKPANRGSQELTITFTPNGSEYGATTLKKTFFVNKRATNR